MSVVETEDKREEDFAKFIEKTVRGPKKGIYEQLLAGLLIKAQNSRDPLVKIHAICEAAFLSTQKEQLDMNLVDAAFTVCTSLMNTELNMKDNKADVQKVDVPWSFPTNEENWKKYIEPWQRITLEYYPLLTSLRHRKYPLKRRWKVSSLYVEDEVKEANEQIEFNEELCNAIYKEIEEMSPSKAFFEFTSALTRNSFFALKAEFEKWSLINLMGVAATIAEEINPKVWKETLQFASKETEGVEQVLGTGA